jgi:hypothetical protein
MHNLVNTLKELTVQMDNLRNNKTVPYLNPYKGIDDCIDLVNRKIRELERKKPNQESN